jgi:uncharacterized protein with LGFP repeats
VGRAVIVSRGAGDEAFLIAGAVLTAYERSGAANGPLGWPTSQPIMTMASCGSVVRQVFEHGVIASNCDGTTTSSTTGR